MEGTERHGQGRYVDESGNVYEGRWVHDKKEGYFQVRSASLRCQCALCHLAHHACVRACMWLQCVFRNHETFNGMFVNDRRHGRGVHTFADGSKVRSL